MNLILTRGIPASGKTTAALAWVAADPANRVRVNRDDLRRMLHGVSFGLTWTQEQQITTLQQGIVKTALEAGRNVIVDDTNLRAKFVREWFAFSDDVAFMDFVIPVEEAIARDSVRAHPVGVDVIRSYAERFTRGGKLQPAPERTPDAASAARRYVPDDSLDPAIIVDIDGTLAHIPEGGRSPYDGSRVHEDIIDVDVARLVNTLSETHRVIVMTGRDAEYREVTETWLTANNVHYDEIHTRPAGDKRKDHIVKLELFDTHVRGRFDIRGVFDDRNRVVQMWREIGLKCLQVQEGNF